MEEPGGGYPSVTRISGHLEGEAHGDHYWETWRANSKVTHTRMDNIQGRVHCL